MDEILKMLKIRETPLDKENLDSLEEDEFIKRRHSCTIFLGYTSNMASCGVRETIRYLAEHRMVCKIINFMQIMNSVAQLM